MTLKAWYSPRRQTGLYQPYLKLPGSGEASDFIERFKRGAALKRRPAISRGARANPSYRLRAPLPPRHRRDRHRSNHRGGRRGQDDAVPAFSLEGGARLGGPRPSGGTLDAALAPTDDRRTWADGHRAAARDLRRPRRVVPSRGLRRVPVHER